MTWLGSDLLRFLAASIRSRTALAAENLFLRKPAKRGQVYYIGKD